MMRRILYLTFICQEGDEDYMYDYNIDQIAESSLPYIQSLYEIHSTLFDQYINK
jgi:hypothetical protein